MSSTNNIALKSLFADKNGFRASFITCIEEVKQKYKARIATYKAHTTSPLSIVSQPVVLSSEGLFI